MVKNPNEVVWKRNEIDSPCINICSIHREERICVGCFRTMDEIGAWSRLSPQDRADIMKDLPNRAPRLRKRRGGRSART